jgi:hypothetical protein
LGFRVNAVTKAASMNQLTEGELGLRVSTRIAPHDCRTALGDGRALATSPARFPSDHLLDFRRLFNLVLSFRTLAAFTGLTDWP